MKNQIISDVCQELIRTESLLDDFFHILSGCNQDYLCCNRDYLDKNLDFCLKNIPEFSPWNSVSKRIESLMITVASDEVTVDEAVEEANIIYEQIECTLRHLADKSDDSVTISSDFFKELLEKFLS